MRKSVAILQLCWVGKLTLKVCMAFWSRKGIEDSTPFTEVYPVSAHRAIFLLGDRWWQFPKRLGCVVEVFDDLLLAALTGHQHEIGAEAWHQWGDQRIYVELLIRVQLKCHVAMLYTIGWCWCLQQAGWFLKSCRQSSIQWALAVLWKDFGSYATKTISMVAQIFDNENARFIHLSSNITGTIL